MRLADTASCTGCAACYSVCPAECIAMREDSEGFLSPVVDGARCRECGLCSDVCPALHPCEERRPLAVYAAKAVDDRLRLQSSSGGVFTLLAEKVVREGGVVFGARFNDEWEVVHDSAETAEALAVFRGSKYVQSAIGGAYLRAEAFLKAGRRVLFSGTPCQIAGLKAFLRRDYENLVTVDLVCHGVPSPGVWRAYLDELILKLKTTKQDISKIAFRNKIPDGWKQSHFSIEMINSNEQQRGRVAGIKPACSNKIYSEPFIKTAYNKCFDFILRPSCYQCHFRSLKSGSDITIGDYWGIQRIFPDFDDNKGVSLVIINSKKGLALYESFPKIDVESNYSDCLKGNPLIENSVRISKKRAALLKRLNDNTSVIKLLTRSGTPYIIAQTQRIFYVIAHRLLRITGLLEPVKRLTGR